jgi:hypothetical protein
MLEVAVLVFPAQGRSLTVTLFRRLSDKASNSGASVDGLGSGKTRGETSSATCSLGEDISGGAARMLRGLVWRDQDGSGRSHCFAQ